MLQPFFLLTGFFASRGRVGCKIGQLAGGAVGYIPGVKVLRSCVNDAGFIKTEHRIVFGIPGLSNAD